MTVLLDTNVLIDYLRDRAAAVALLEGLGSKPSMSVCTILELTAGARSRREESKIESLEGIMRVLPVTADIARSAGQHVKQFQAGHGLDEMDALIAATAEHHGLELATLNVKHFPMLKGLKAAY